MLITLDVRSGATVDIVFVTTVVTDCSFGGGSRLTGGSHTVEGSVGGGSACGGIHSLVELSAC